MRPLAVTLVAAALIATAPAQAAEPDPAALAEAIAAPWPDRQVERGAFEDYMAVRRSPSIDKYGVAALGHALLQTGLRLGDQRLIGSGLRALVRSVEAPRPYHSIAFEKHALAAGYNLARARVPAHPVFRQGRAAWERRVKAMGPTWIGQGRAPYFNQFLTDALMLIELNRSGLRSTDREALQLLNGTLPEISRSQSVGSTTMATDGPLAYHALTLAFTARAIQLLGSRAGARPRRLLQRFARATWAYAGPDGDLAWFGRSHQQSWVLSLAAYGMEVAARDAPPARAAAFRAVSRRALGRLRALHVGGPYGLHLTPAFRFGLSRGVPAQDGYVSGPAYTGLTLNGLEWLAALGPPGRSSRLAGDSALAARLGRGAGSFAVVSTGRVWFAVRRSSGTPGDLRSAGGLVAVKVRDRSGVWRDALPQRPITRRGGSAGPVLRRAGVTTAPQGRSLSLGRGGAVFWGVDFRGRGRSTITFRPAGCGVRVSLPVAPGDRHELDVFLPTTPRPRRGGRHSVLGGNLRATYSGGGHIRTGGEFSGAIDGPMVRSRLSARSFRTGRVMFNLRSRARC